MITYTHPIAANLPIKTLVTKQRPTKLVMLTHFSLSPQPVQYKLTSKLARLLGIHTAKRPDIINAVWQYINVSHVTSGVVLIPRVC